MSQKNTLKNVFIVILSNVLRLAASILIGFVLPELLGIVEYGYYKTFFLYSTYIALTNVGFADGIYLKFGGKSISELNKSDFRQYFLTFLIVQFSIFVIGVTVSQIFLGIDYKTVVLLLFVTFFAANINNYFQLISQMTSRFKEFSIRLILISLANLLIIGIMFVFKSSSYVLYLSLLAFIQYAIMAWYLFTYRDFVFGKATNFKEIKRDILQLFLIGLPLMASNISASFVLVIDKQIIKSFFDIETFSIYSFAYSMLTLITVVVSAISIVLYPVLKKISPDQIKHHYSRLNSVVISIVLLGISIYFPLVYIIPKFLPQYIDSLQILRIAFPGLILSSSITAIKHNFYKTTNNNLHFLLISIFAIVFVLGLNLLSYYIFGEVWIITLSSIVGIFVWYIVTEIYLVVKYKVKWQKNMIAVVVGIAIFYLTAFLENYIIGGVLYFIAIAALTLIFYKNEIRFFFLEFKNRKTTDNQ